MAKEKRPVGRPTKYDADLQEKADRYLQEWATTDAVPSRVGLCVWLGISKPTTFEWERQYPQFSDTLAAIDAMQEHVAINKGITGVFNSTIVKLILANHGYSDKVQQDNISTDRSMSPTQAGDAVLSALEKKHRD